MKYESCQITISSLGSSGEGVGQLENGLKVFVPNALPGEVINCQIKNMHKTYAHGSIESIVKPSKDRIEAKCAYYNTCGGCQIMHMRYDAQLEAKTQKVVDAFNRIGKFEAVKVNDCKASPESFHYRNKLQLPVSGGKRSVRLGLFEKGSHNVVPIDTCLTQNGLGNEILAAIHGVLERFEVQPYDERTGSGLLRHVLIRTVDHNNKALAVLVTTGKKKKLIKALAVKIEAAHPAIQVVVENINQRRDNVILGSKYDLLAGSGNLVEELTVLGEKYLFEQSASSFFQVNKSQAEQLYSRAIELADLNKENVVVDAFCGIGTLSLFAAKHVHSVIGIETIHGAISNAKKNAELNHIENAEFSCGRVEDNLKLLSKADVIFLNPPRAGCKPEVLKAVAESNIKRVIYISCNPSTQARDCAILAEKGYNLGDSEPFDMFPQTMHVENITVMTRN